MFTSFDKAIAAFLASVVYIFSTFGLDLPFISDPSVQGVIGGLIVAIVTYFVPNKEAPKPPVEEGGQPVG